MSTAVESIYHGALSYSLSLSAFERLVYLALEKNYVRLGFNYSAYLPDPEHLLNEEGKRLRHVKVYTIEQADQPVIRYLVQSSWVDGSYRVTEMKNEVAKSRKTRK